MPAGYGYAGSGDAKPDKKKKDRGSSYMKPTQTKNPLEKKAKKRSF